MFAWRLSTQKKELYYSQMIALQSHGLKQTHQPQSQEEAMDKEPGNEVANPPG